MTSPEIDERFTQEMELAAEDKVDPADENPMTGPELDEGVAQEVELAAEGKVESAAELIESAPRDEDEVDPTDNNGRAKRCRRRVPTFKIEFCSVQGCLNSSLNAGRKSPPITFFRFPGKSNPARREFWTQFVNRKPADGIEWQPSRGSRICNRHFVANIKVDEPNSQSYNPSIGQPERIKNLSNVTASKIKRIAVRRRKISSHGLLQKQEQQSGLKKNVVDQSDQNDSNPNKIKSELIPRKLPKKSPTKWTKAFTASVISIEEKVAIIRKLSNGKSLQEVAEERGLPEIAVQSVFGDQERILRVFQSRCALYSSNGRKQESRARNEKESEEKMECFLGDMIVMIGELTSGRKQKDVAKEWGLQKSAVSNIWADRERIKNCFTQTELFDSSLNEIPEAKDVSASDSQDVDAKVDDQKDEEDEATKNSDADAEAASVENDRKSMVRRKRKRSASSSVGTSGKRSSPRLPGVKRYELILRILNGESLESVARSMELSLEEVRSVWQEKQWEQHGQNQMEDLEEQQISEEEPDESEVPLDVRSGRGRAGRSQGSSSRKRRRKLIAKSVVPVVERRPRERKRLTLLDKIEIIRGVKACDCNCTRASQELGIARSTVFAVWVDRHKINAALAAKGVELEEADGGSSTNDEAETAVNDESNAAMNRTENTFPHAEVLEMPAKSGDGSALPHPTVPRFPISVGDRFTTFDEVIKKVRQIEQETGVPLHLLKDERIEMASQKLLYCYVRFRCEFWARHGMDTPDADLKTCDAGIWLAVSEKGTHLEVVELNNEHNHVIYQQKRAILPATASVQLSDNPADTKELRAVSKADGDESKVSKVPYPISKGTMFPLLQDVQQRISSVERYCNIPLVLKESQLWKKRKHSEGATAEQSKTSRPPNCKLPYRNLVYGCDYYNCIRTQLPDCKVDLLELEDMKKCQSRIEFCTSDDGKFLVAVNIHHWHNHKLLQEVGLGPLQRKLNQVPLQQILSKACDWEGMPVVDSLCDDHGHQGLIFQDEKMRLTFELFPQLIYISGWNIPASSFPSTDYPLFNKSGYTVYVGMNMDGRGHSGVVFIFLATYSCDQLLIDMFEAYKGKNPRCDQTVAVLIDADVVRPFPLRIAFDGDISVTQGLCHLATKFRRHIMQPSLPLEASQRKLILDVVEDFVFSNSDDKYVELFGRLKQFTNMSEVVKYIDGQAKVFQKSWTSFLEVQAEKRVYEAMQRMDGIFRDPESLESVFSRLLQVAENLRTAKACTMVPSDEDDERPIDPDILRYERYLTPVAYEMVKTQFRRMGKGGRTTFLADPDQDHCSCYYWTYVRLPCAHIFIFRRIQELALFSTNLVHERWTRDYVRMAVQRCKDADVKKPDVADCPPVSR